MWEGGKEGMASSGIIDERSKDNLQEMALDGQKHLEGTVEATHDILASLNTVLCDSVLWSQPVRDGGSKSGAPQDEQGWLELDSSLLRYKTTTAALRASISSIFNKTHGDFKRKIVSQLERWSC